MSLVTYIAHKWRDKTFLTLKKKYNHPQQCPCEIKLLKDRAIDRPFLTESIRRPMKINNEFKNHSERDTEILIKVGLHISTILCANHNSTPAVPRNMTNYTNSEMRINQVFCRAYSGRSLRYNAILKPACHSIT